MTRCVQITPTATVFVQSGGPFVTINTGDWIHLDKAKPEPFSDVSHAVRSQIIYWMEGTNNVEFLIERLEHHKLSPKKI